MVGQEGGRRWRGIQRYRRRGLVGVVGLVGVQPDQTGPGEAAAWAALNRARRLASNQDKLPKTSLAAARANRKTETEEGN